MAQAQIDEDKEYFHWSIASGDTIYQLDSVSFGEFGNARLDRDWSYAEQHFLNALNIKFESKVQRQDLRSMCVIHGENSITVEQFFFSIQDILFLYSGLVALLNRELKMYERQSFYELNSEGRVHARGESWTRYRDGEQRNVLVYIEFIELPSNLKLSAPSWEAVDNVKLVLRSFEL